MKRLEFLKKYHEEDFYTQFDDILEKTNDIDLIKYERSEQIITSETLKTFDIKEIKNLYIDHEYVKSLDGTTKL